ncbi:hypothetical protein EHP00_186 [Ecytonucleospora hepatopenaei]|uniref:Uncharacterized protein n=1 Tax=Ecytonucleospora hepatopenaei TaxID=646526 RepID=A0A1W0E6F4_9MICR|nr:hypothetical protein EHP00_186 [Ecytonucleospora hepatopenaei]
MVLLSFEKIKELYADKHSGEILRFAAFAKEDTFLNFIYSVLFKDDVECQMEDFLLKLLESQKICCAIVKHYTGIEIEENEIENVKTKATSFIGNRKFGLLDFPGNVYKKVFLFLLHVEKSFEMLCNVDPEFIFNVFKDLVDSSKEKILNEYVSPIKLMLYRTFVFEEIFKNSCHCMFYLFLESEYNVEAKNTLIKKITEMDASKEIDVSNRYISSIAPKTPQQKSLLFLSENIKKTILSSNFTFINNKIYYFYNVFPEYKTYDRISLRDKNILQDDMDSNYKLIRFYAEKSLLKNEENDKEKTENNCVLGMDLNDLECNKIENKKHYVTTILNKIVCLILEDRLQENHKNLIKMCINDWLYEELYLNVKSYTLLDLFLLHVKDIVLKLNEKESNEYKKKFLKFLAYNLPVLKDVFVRILEFSSKHNELDLFILYFVEKHPFKKLQSVLKRNRIYLSKVINDELKVYL